MFSFDVLSFMILIAGSVTTAHFVMREFDTFQLELDLSLARSAYSRSTLEPKVVGRANRADNVVSSVLHPGLGERDLELIFYTAASL
jgi:hypothetical protein